MANIVVRQGKTALGFDCLRPVSKQISMEKRSARSCERSRSEPRSRFKTSRMSSPGSPRRNLKEIEELIAEAAKQNLPVLKQVFQTLDRLKTGTVTQGEFAQVLHSYCNITLPLHDLMKFYDKLGVNEDGRVSYTKFLMNYFTGENDGRQEMSTLCSMTKEDFESKLISKLRGQHSSIWRAMKLFDYNKDGFIKKRELRGVLENFCFRMTDLQFERLWVKYDRSNNGSMLNYIDFLDDLREVEPSSKENEMEEPPSLSASPLFPLPAENFDEDAFREKFIANCDEIRRAITILDYRASGYVLLSEFKKIVMKYTIPLSEVVLHSLLQRCGVQVSHRINYDRFIDFYGKAQANILWQPEASTGEEDVFNALQSHIHSNFMSIKDAFLEFDYNKDGKISRSELRRVIEKFSFRLSEEDHTKLMSRIDPEHKGYISYDRFLEIFRNNAGQVLLEADAKSEGSVPHKMTSSRGSHMSPNQVKQCWSMFPFNRDNKDFLSFQAKNIFERDCSRLSSTRTPPQKLRHHNRARSAPLLRPSTSQLRTSSPCKPPLSKGQFTSASQRRSPVQIPDGNVKEIELRVKDEICNKWQSLKTSFMDHDVLNSGVVPLQSFKDVLAVGNVPLAPDEICILGRKHEDRNTGNISYMEFLRSFLKDQLEEPVDKTLSRSKLQPTRILYNPGKPTDHFLAIVAKFRLQIRQDWKSMRRSFKALDYQGNGTCSILAFRHVLKKYKMQLSEEEFYHVAAYYDKNVNNRIPYNEFLGAHLD